MFTSTGKKHRTAAIVTFDQGLRSPNHAFVIGANAMIGTAFAAIMYGIRALPNGRQRARTSAAMIAAPLPSTKPPTASLRVIHAPRRSRSRSSIKRSDDVGEPREQEVLDPEHVREEPLPGGKPEGEDRDRGRPVPDPLAEPRWRLSGRVERAHTISLSATSGSSTSSAPVACSNSRTWVTSSKKRGSSRVAAVVAAAGQRIRRPRSGPAAGT